MVGVEFVGDRIQEVSVAGDSQADYAGFGVCQRGAHRRAVVGSVMNGADRADHAGGLSVVAALSRQWGNVPTSTGKTVWALIGPENCI